MAVVGFVLSQYIGIRACPATRTIATRCALTSAASVVVATLAVYIVAGVLYLLWEILNMIFQGGPFLGMGGAG